MKFIFLRNILNPARGIRNLDGWLDGYGGCMHCQDRWNWARRKQIPISEERTMFPLCEDCFNKLAPEKIIAYCDRLIKGWRKTDQEFGLLDVPYDAYRNCARQAVQEMKS